MVGCAANVLPCSAVSEGIADAASPWFASTANSRARASGAPGVCWLEHSAALAGRALRSSFLDTAPSAHGSAATDYLPLGTSSPSRLKCYADDSGNSIAVLYPKRDGGPKGWTSFTARDKARGLSPHEVHNIKRHKEMEKLDRHNKLAQALKEIDVDIDKYKAIMLEMKKNGKKDDGEGHTFDQYNERIEDLQRQRREVLDRMSPPDEVETGEMQYAGVTKVDSGVFAKNAVKPQEVAGGVNEWAGLAYEAVLRAKQFEKLAKEAASNAEYYDYVARAAASHAQAAQLQVELSSRASMEHDPTIVKILTFCRKVKAVLEEDPSKASDHDMLEMREFCSNIDDSLDASTRVPVHTEIGELGYPTYEQPTRDYPIPPPPPPDSTAIGVG